MAAVDKISLSDYASSRASPAAILGGSSWKHPSLVNIGVLLEDPETDSLRLRFRRDLDSLAGEEEPRCWPGLADDLAHKASEMGAGEAVRIFGIQRSPMRIQVTDREEVPVDDFGRRSTVCTARTFRATSSNFAPTCLATH